MSTYTRLNLGAIPADTAVHTKCRNCTGRVLVSRVTLSCNKRARDQEIQALGTRIHVFLVRPSLVNEPGKCGETILAVEYELTKRTQEKLFADWAQ